MELWLMTGVLVSGLTSQGRRLGLKLSICRDLFWVTWELLALTFMLTVTGAFLLSLIACYRRWQ